ncbi:hypothetical protein ABZ883_22015 [Streptomyces sp. NPDC046977]|uniref:hypothetical protein n=1 Tax=Streptomyces sp. NPDC046977 TaxID=3154703 RepID=UPI0033DF7C7E
MSAQPHSQVPRPPRDDAAEAAVDAALREARFGRLPERVPLEKTVESRPVAAPNDPGFGRNPDTDWLIRYCA